MEYILILTCKMDILEETCTCVMYWELFAIFWMLITPKGSLESLWWSLSIKALYKTSSCLFITWKEPFIATRNSRLYSCFILFNNSSKTKSGLPTKGFVFSETFYDNWGQLRIVRIKLLKVSCLSDIVLIAAKCISQLGNRTGGTWGMYRDVATWQWQNKPHLSAPLQEMMITMRIPVQDNCHQITH